MARTRTIVLRVASLSTRSTTQPGTGYIFCIPSSTPANLGSYTAAIHAKCGRAAMPEAPTLERLESWERQRSMLPGEGRMIEFVAGPGSVDSPLRRACNDCHSDETRWPWYSRIAPLSWLIAREDRQDHTAAEIGQRHEDLAPGDAPAEVPGVEPSRCPIERGRDENNARYRSSSCVRVSRRGPHSCILYTVPQTPAASYPNSAEPISTCVPVRRSC